MVEERAQPPLGPTSRWEVQALELGGREHPSPGQILHRLEVALAADPRLRVGVRTDPLRDSVGHRGTHGSGMPTPHRSHSIQPAPAPQRAQRPTQPW